MGEAAFHIGYVTVCALAYLGAGWVLGAAAGLVRRWWGSRDSGCVMSESWRRARPSWAGQQETEGRP